MAEKNRDRLIIAAAVIAAGTVGACLLVRPADRRTISAVGICRAKIARDKFALTLQVRALNKSASESLRLARAGADDIVRRVGGIGDKSAEIQTRNINSYQKTEWRDNKSADLGVETTITIDIAAAAKGDVDAILSNAGRVSGADITVQGVRNFSSEQVVADAAANCLAVAVGDARAKAAAIAGGDGEGLGRLMSAKFTGEDRDNGHSPVMLRAAARDSMAFGDYLQSADGDLSVSVETVFGIR